MSIVAPTGTKGHDELLIALQRHAEPAQQSNPGHYLPTGAEAARGGRTQGRRNREARLTVLNTEHAAVLVALEVLFDRLDRIERNQIRIRGALDA